MILKALADYYERIRNDPERDVPPPGFERKGIPFLIVIDKNGNFVGIRDVRREDDKGQTAREFLVPKGEKKTSGIKANLLWDTPQYVLGVPRDESEKSQERAEMAFHAFQDRLNNEFGSEASDEGIQAVKRFLSKEEFSRVLTDEKWPEIQEANPNITFILEDDDSLIVQRPEVIEILSQEGKSSRKSQVCSVTGENDVPAELHTSIKGVWGAQTSGANIVSFNLDAFRSFGKKQGLNAPIGQRTVFAYTTALNLLLAKGSRQRLQVGDTSAVFWAKEGHSFEEDFSCFLGEPQKDEEPDYGKIRTLLTAVRTGMLPPEDEMPFYVLGLAPNASRISIRFWYEGSVRDLKEKIASHLEDIAIVRSPYDREFLSLFQLLISTAAEGKADNIQPKVGGELVRAILNGTCYPRSLLAGALQRCKAEQRINRSRAALIKGFLVRESRIRGLSGKEVGMALDKTNANPGYILGRLFAVLERIQEQAHASGLNKTIRDTYFSAATSNPLVTFKRLQDLAVHHLAKIRNSGQQTVWHEKLLQEVMEKVPAEGVPAALSLEDQGRFAVGYYHQRQAFFQKKENGEKESENG